MALATPIKKLDVPILATASLPNRPTKSISTRLYVSCNTELAIIGKAKATKTETTFPCVKSIFFIATPLL